MKRGSLLSPTLGTWTWSACEHDPSVVNYLEKRVQRVVLHLVKTYQSDNIAPPHPLVRTTLNPVTYMSESTVRPVL